MQNEENELVIRGNHQFFVFGLDSQEGQVVGRIQVSDQSPSFFGETSSVVGDQVAFAVVGAEVGPENAFGLVDDGVAFHSFVLLDSGEG